MSATGTSTTVAAGSHNARRYVEITASGPHSDPWEISQAHKVDYKELVRLNKQISGKFDQENLPNGFKVYLPKT